MKSILKITCLAILVTSANLYGKSNNIKFDHISLKHGLSQSTVHCILQDSDGFMWFGTYDGLNKYDGYNFTVYKPDLDNPNSLSNNEVWSIYEDQSRVLWIGTLGGLNKFDRETETFTHYRNEPNNPRSLSDNFVRSIYEDQSGVLWIGTHGGGLNRFDREKETFTHYQHDPNNPPSLSHNSVYSIYEDQSGALWIGTDAGLNQFDREKETFTHYQHDPNNPRSLSHNSVYSIYEDQSGVLWIGTNGGGLDKLARKTQTFAHYKNNPNDPNSLSDNKVRSIYGDQSGVLWIGTNSGGLDKLDRKTQTFTHYKNNPNDPNSLSDNKVRSIYGDQSGVLWIGTDGGGLNKFDRQREKFTHYRHVPNDPNSLSDNVIFSLYEDQSGVLWIGTRSGGLTRLDPRLKQGGRKGTFTHYKNEPGNPNSLSDNRVRAIYEDQTGVLWIGTHGGGLNQFDREKGIFTHYKNEPGNPNSLSDNRVRAIYEDRAGVLWIGTRRGLDQFDRDQGTFKHYRNEPGNSKSLSDNEVLTIYEDQAGVLWIGTGGGLNRFDRKKGTFIHYESEPGNPNSLSDNRVRVIYEDQSGVIWLGASSGLNKLVLGWRSRGLHAGSESARSGAEKDIFQRYREKDGLPNDVIYGILEDDNGNLWLSTNKGLSKFNPKAGSKGEFRNYDVSDGLQSNEFTSGAYYKSKSGEMFFGGINGLNVFHPDSVKDNPHIPQIVITDFLIFNQSAALGTHPDSPLQKHITETEEIVLSHKQNVFSFGFAALHYTNPTKNQYAYKMEGFDGDWVKSGTRRFTTYTNLDPGDYVFRVKGSNSDGVWNEEGATIKVTITPPFWQTWWFRIVAATSVLGIAFGWHRARMKNIEAQRKKLEIQVAEKTKEIREAQAHLVQSEKMAALGTLTAGIGHELNTPVGALKSTLDIMDRCRTRIDEIFEGSKTLEELKNSTDYQKSLRILKENRRVASSASERIIAIVGSLRNFIRLDEAEFQKVDIHEGIESALTLIQHEIGEGIRVIKEYGDVPEIQCFASELNQAVMTLLRNAVQAVEKDGTITIKTWADETNVHVKIADTGRDMPSEKLKTLFDFRFTVQSSRVGVGMELSNAYNIVQKHNGELRVESEVGKGTTFTISLPIEQ